MIAAMTTMIAAVLWTAAPSGDLAKLQGTWQAQAGPGRVCPVTLEVSGCSVKVTVTPPIGPKIEASGELKLDESASPKALDWLRFTGEDGQDFPEVFAIYELVDADTLRVGNAGPSNPRPTEFVPGDGVLADVLTFRRESKPLATAESSR